MQTRRATLLGGVALLALGGPACAWRTGLKNPLSFTTDFGGVGDGVTDNTGALNAFGTFSRQRSAISPGPSAGTPLVLNVAAGTYLFSVASAFTSLFGSKALVVNAAGAVFKNTQTGAGASPWMPSCFPSLRKTADGGVSALIQTTSAGARSVTCVTAGDASQFAIGDPAAIMSEDIQISSSNFSYPPNCNKFDYVTVTAVNTMTGAVSVIPALQNVHSSANIDGPTGNISCGKARIWKLNNGASGVTSEWNTDLVFKSIEIQLPAAAIPTPYIGMLGRYQSWQGCTLSGMSPQMADRIEVIDCDFTDDNEPDKLLNELISLRCHYRNGLLFQSSGINNVWMDGDTIDVNLASGMAKHFVGRNLIIAAYSEAGAGTRYGHNLTTALTGCSIVTWPFFVPIVLGGANAVTIDGALITYASGVITLPKNTAELASWNMVPGTSKLNICAGAGNHFTGDVGTGLVTSLTEDSTNIYVHVSGWPSSLPAYSTTGQIFISRSGPFVGTNLTGARNAVRASAAAIAGKYMWQLWSDTITGNALTGESLQYVGALISAAFNVTVTSGAAGAKFQIAGTAVVDTDFSDPKTLIITIDLTQSGARNFTTSALTGKVGNDSVTLDGVAQTALPSGRWLRSVSWAYADFTPSPTVPSMTLAVEFDPGTEFRDVS